MAQNVVGLDVYVLMEDVDGIVVEEMELGRQVLRAKATQGWDCADKWTCEAHLVTKEQRTAKGAVKCITAKIRG
jgi:GH25 family lysozyme M1 (1,4-beta-N-acetylmuramidase)